MTCLLNDLYAAVEIQNEQKIIEILTKIAQGVDIEIQNNDLINNLFNISNDKIKQLSVKVIAESAKSEANRKILTNSDTVSYLLTLIHSEDECIILNAIRALGNICYENYEAAKLIDKKGLDKIIAILKMDDSRSDSTITTKTLGLLMNVLSTNEELQKPALNDGILTILENLLKKYSKVLNEDDTILSYLLNIISALADYLDELNICFTESLCNAIIDIFKHSTNTDLSFICFGIFHGQAEKDEVKILLAKQGVCEVMFELIEKHRHKVNDEDSRSVLKMACDLIVIVLTGDECMNMLYDNGKGKVYENMISWLHSDDADLLSTGILAVGNFARKDAHCVQMVQNGISKKLIELLSKYNTSTSDLKIQHALLSTLKNLVIPKQNKAQVIEEGLIDIIYPMIQIEQYLVIFKLLGTFRMVIDGQEKSAMELISKSEFLEKLVYWCYNSDHLGVRGEVPRLLAWLIRNCHSFKPFANLLSVKDSVKCIVEMISSNHAVMQNEAFTAIYLLSIGCSNTNTKSKQNGAALSQKPEFTNPETTKFNDELIEADFGKNVNFVVTKYGDKMDKQTIDNLLTLLEQLVTRENVRTHLKLSKVGEALTSLKNKSNAQNSTEKLDKMITAITN